MPLMASALLGNKSIISSELFRYVFPHANISYVNSVLQFDSNLCNDESVKILCSIDDNINTHNSVLMQSWKQFGKKMNMMSFVGAQICTKQLMARLYS